MKNERTIQISKEYLKAKLGLQATDGRFSDIGDRTFIAKVIVIADNRQFEVIINRVQNSMRLAEIHSVDSLQTFLDTEKYRKPFAMRLGNGRVLYFDTNEEMVSHSSRNDIDWIKIGRTEEIVKI